MSSTLYVIDIERYSLRKHKYAPIWVNAERQQRVLYDPHSDYLNTILRRLKGRGFPKWHPAGRDPAFYIREIEHELSAREGTKGALVSELYDIKQLNRTVLGLPLMKPYPDPLVNSRLFGEKVLDSPPELFGKC
jgi:hypothetical protein